EYCISRRSTLAVSTLTPALKVLSRTRPVSTFLSLVRTNAPPLPGLTCWNSTTAHSSPPSSFSTMPFLRSLVVATRSLPRAAALKDEQLLGRLGEQFRPTPPGHDGVLDANTAQARKVERRLNGDRPWILKSPGRGGTHERIRVDLEPDAVAEGGREVVAVACGGEDGAGGGVALPGAGAGGDGGPPGTLGLGDEVVDL